MVIKEKKKKYKKKILKLGGGGGGGGGGVACGTYGRQRRSVHGYWWRDLRIVNRLQNLGVDWRIILK